MLVDVLGNLDWERGGVSGRCSFFSSGLGGFVLFSPFSIPYREKSCCARLSNCFDYSVFMAVLEVKREKNGQERKGTWGMGGKTLKGEPLYILPSSKESGGTWQAIIESGRRRLLIGGDSSYAVGFILHYTRTLTLDSLAPTYE